MKKRSVLVLLSVLLVFSFVLAGCGSKGSKSPYVGTTWSISGGKDAASGVEITKEFLSMGGIDDFKIELKDKGVATVTVSGETEDTKWSEKDNVITLESGGEELKATIDGDKMTIEQDGSELYFEKQK
jgi:hypothetical protein